MSGGVDSSVSVALLKKRGFDVVGVFMKLWGKEGNKCCTPESERAARITAKKLGIPFYVINLEKEFKKRVVDYFIEEIKKGRTPNPCVVCNREIKFGLLFEKALAMGGDYIATGHYAKIREGNIFKGKDKEKDQSYFLWKLKKKTLKRIIFPVGNYLKGEVKDMAKDFDLPEINSKESMEICFIKTTINDFLAERIKLKKGKIIDLKGKELGEHKGLLLYTIGQRKGIGLPGGPYFVLKKDVKKNILVVTKEEKDLLVKQATLKEINWIGEKSSRVSVKARYRAPGKPAIVSGRKIQFLKPERAVTPGQSAVFYKGNKLLGGGVIFC